MRGLAEFAGLLHPHALNRNPPAGRALARLAAATLAYLEDEAAGVEAAAAVAGDALRAREWRTIWDRLGVGGVLDRAPVERAAEPAEPGTGTGHGGTR